MRATPKRTAFRRNRSFGDVHGGRGHRKVTDGVFAFLHPLRRPAEGQSTPILIEDNPSKDLYFPLGGHELLQAIDALPKKVTEGITHLWLRRPLEGRSTAPNSPLLSSSAEAAYA